MKSLIITIMITVISSSLCSPYSSLHAQEPASDASEKSPEKYFYFDARGSIRKFPLNLLKSPLLDGSELRSDLQYEKCLMENDSYNGYYMNVSPAALDELLDAVSEGDYVFKSKKHAEKVKKMAVRNKLRAVVKLVDEFLQLRPSADIVKRIEDKTGIPLAKPIKLNLFKPSFYYMDSFSGNQWKKLATNDEIPFVNDLTGNIKDGFINVSARDPQELQKLEYIKEISSWKSTKLRAPIPVLGIAGDLNRGAIIFGGPNRDEIYYYATNTQTWIYLGHAPFPIEGIAGENSGGIIIYRGRDMAILDNYKNFENWKTFKAPFDIQGMSGTVGSKVVIFGKDNPTSSTQKIAFLENYQNINMGTISSWTEVTPPQVKIDSLIGNGKRGFVIQSGNAFMYQEINSSEWKRLRDLPSSLKILKMSGDYGPGPMVMVEDPFEESR